MIRKIIATAFITSFVSFCQAQGTALLQPTLLPSSFISGQRFYLKLATVNGDTLLGFCDTGGGTSFTFNPVVKKIKRRSKVKKNLMMRMAGVGYIPFREVVQDRNVPAPSLKHKHPLTQKAGKPVLMVLPDKGEIAFMRKAMTLDVFLGQNFFMEKAWTFDYPKQQIWVNTPLPLNDTLFPNVQKLGFKKNAQGTSEYGHPSMQVEIDGEPIDVLFDSGASIILSEKGKAAFHTTDTTIGGSFIAASVFDKWRSKHPEWNWYEKADLHADVIEVPRVTISGQTVGPVIFATRPDAAWSQGMIHSMDKVVKGAIGGSALQYLSVTIDYNTDLVRFSKAE